MWILGLKGLRVSVLSRLNLEKINVKAFPRDKENQGLQILLMSGVGMTSASQILESFCNIWSQVSQRKKPFSDFPARGPGMYTLS